MKLSILLIALPLLVFSLTLKESFNSWSQIHGKEYSTGEYNHRLNIYKQNLEFIENHNREHLGFTVAMNQFGDLTSEEFGHLYLGSSLNMSESNQENAYYDPLFDSVGDTVDWRTKGAVTGVKNQGQCGSCWAFSTTGSVEGAWKIKKGSLVSLSEQNLVDCSKSQGNQGCNGGFMDNAFKYIISNHGIDTEASYGYVGKDSTCKFNKATIGATLTSYKDVTKNSEPSLTSALQAAGPVSVAIDASHSSFQFYSSGVYYEKACSSSRLDHGVLAVGYGTQGTSDYYIVKNSWGSSWGQQGYILMSRNKQNNCGIAAAASYPIV